MRGPRQPGGPQGSLSVTRAIVPLPTDLALFRQFLQGEMRRCARSGYADPVVIRYRDLARADRLDKAEAQEYAGLFNRMYSRWRWRQATAQALAHKRMSQ